MPRTRLPAHSAGGLPGKTVHPHGGGVDSAVRIPPAPTDPFGDNPAAPTPAVRPRPGQPPPRHRVQDRKL